MQKIYYIAFYGDRSAENFRPAHPAADLQVSYLAKLLSEMGYQVEILSVCVSGNTDCWFDFCRGCTKSIDDNIVVRYFSNIGSKSGFIRVLGRMITRKELRSFIKEKKEDIIIIYHSTALYPIYHFLDRIGKKFILEVEEIYADFTGDDRKLELREISRASEYIIPTQLLVPEVTRGKKWVLYHGSCFEERIYEKRFQDNRIHIVYAGTLDYRKVGELVAIDTAKFLDARYHIHILGIGTDNEVRHIKQKINSLQNMECKISYDGVLYGEEYLSFLQSCDIGLYTQSSADVVTSFPSKLMSYLGNGLRIVANRTPTLEQSEIRHLIWFCDHNEPKSVAEAIRNVDFDASYDSRKELRKIQERLMGDLKNLLDEV